MLDNCKNAKERWGGVSEIIDRWLKVAAGTDCTLCAISGSAETTRSEVLTNQLEQLCQQMMDYVFGHFGSPRTNWFGRRKISKTKTAMALADKIIPLLKKTGWSDLMTALM